MKTKLYLRKETVEILKNSMRQVGGADSVLNSKEKCPTYTVILTNCGTCVDCVEISKEGTCVVQLCAALP